MEAERQTTNVRYVRSKLLVRGCRFIDAWAKITQWAGVLTILTSITILAVTVYNQYHSFILTFVPTHAFTPSRRPSLLPAIAPD